MIGLMKRFESKEDIYQWGQVWADVGTEMICQLKILEIEGNDSAANLVRLFQSCYDVKIKEEKEAELVGLRKRKKRERNEESIFAKRSKARV